MTNRILSTILLLAIAFSITAFETSDTVDIASHNAFATQYNLYIDERNHSVVDLRTIHRMRKAWRELEHNAGWPIER
jgi:hypothetical protein